MTITRTPQLEALIRQKVASGQYDTASYVVQEALRLLEEKERRPPQGRDRRGFG